MISGGFLSHRVPPVIIHLKRDFPMELNHLYVGVNSFMATPKWSCFLLSAGDWDVTGMSHMSVWFNWQWPGWGRDDARWRNHMCERFDFLKEHMFKHIDMPSMHSKYRRACAFACFASKKPGERHCESHILARLMNNQESSYDPWHTSTAPSGHRSQKLISTGNWHERNHAKYVSVACTFQKNISFEVTWVNQ